MTVDSVGVCRFLRGVFRRQVNDQLMAEKVEIDRDTSGSNQSEAEMIESLRHTIEESVRLRLHADVPVGVCLSGGLDSSASQVSFASTLA